MYTRLFKWITYGYVREYGYRGARKVTERRCEFVVQQIDLGLKLQEQNLGTGICMLRVTSGYEKACLREEGRGGRMVG
jgi:hypothetical protein